MPAHKQAVEQTRRNSNKPTVSTTYSSSYRAAHSVTIEPADMLAKWTAQCAPLDLAHWTAVRPSQWPTHRHAYSAPLCKAQLFTVDAAEQSA